MQIYIWTLESDFINMLHQGSDACRYFHEPRLASWNLPLRKYRRIASEEEISPTRSGVQHSGKSSCRRALGSSPTQLLVLCTSSCEICCCDATSGKSGSCVELLMASALCRNCSNSINVVFSLKIKLLLVWLNSCPWTNVYPIGNSYR